MNSLIHTGGALVSQGSPRGESSGDKSTSKGRYTRQVLLPEHVQAHFARVSTHEGAFSSSLSLPRALSAKYLTGWISWSILRGGNSALEDEVYPWTRWYTPEELCSRSLPLKHAPGAKSLVCIGLNRQGNSAGCLQKTEKIILSYMFLIIFNR